MVQRKHQKSHNIESKINDGGNNWQRSFQFIVSAFNVLRGDRRIWMQEMSQVVVIDEKLQFHLFHFSKQFSTTQLSQFYWNIVHNAAINEILKTLNGPRSVWHIKCAVSYCDIHSDIVDDIHLLQRNLFRWLTLQRCSNDVRKSFHRQQFRNISLKIF